MRSKKRQISLEVHRDDIDRCVKCGSCGAVCPTYLHERDESFSARGRVALIKAVLDGRLTVSEIFKDRLATCTTCLACESACPSNVPVTEILQAAKEQAVAESGMGIISSVIAGTVKQPALIRAAAWLAPVALHYSKSPGSRIKGQRLRSAPDKDVRGQAPCGVRNEKEKSHRAKGRVAFFPGCAVEYFHPDIGQATIRVLNAIGYDVIVPDDLKCCGRPLLSLGDRQSAEELAAHNAALFEALEVDAIVTACASCGLTFKRDYPKLLRPGAKTPVVLDIHEFLAGRIEGVKLNPVLKSVTVHDPCHLGRGQGLSRTVRDLLRTIPGLTLVEMKDPDRCCGFGGVMRITHRELSDGIAVDKVNNIVATRAAVVATGCPGCCMQIADALKRNGSEIGVVHPVQLLEEALSIEDRP
ncbi:MAG: (Fe-S)-binding protein [Nitrospirae bacterium]|nr:(Fe-S)-binding protein [Nitrospirota bacterium]